MHKIGCPNCGNTNNEYRQLSEPWTGTIHCVACSRLILTIYGDRMGGALDDEVIVYKER